MTTDSNGINKSAFGDFSFTRNLQLISDAQAGILPGRLGVLDIADLFADAEHQSLDYIYLKYRFILSTVERIERCRVPIEGYTQKFLPVLRPNVTNYADVVYALRQAVAQGKGPYGKDPILSKKTVQKLLTSMDVPPEKVFMLTNWCGSGESDCSVQQLGTNLDLTACPLDAIDTKPLAEQSATNKIQKLNHRSVQQNEFDQRTIGALALLLMQKSSGKASSSVRKPTDQEIDTGIQQILSNFSEDIIEQDSSRLKETLREAIAWAIQRPGASITTRTMEYNLRTIGSLTLLLVKNTVGGKYGSVKKPNKTSIYTAVHQILYNLEVSTDGQKGSRLNDVLEKAVAAAKKQPCTSPNN